MRPHLCRRLAAALVAVLGISQAAQLPPRNDARLQSAVPTARDILHESYHLAQNFIPSQRAYHLFAIANASHSIAPDLSYRWAHELLRLTSALDPDWDRGVLQKNAVVVIAHERPLEALHLLQTIDPPMATGSVSVPEDLRASAAMSVYADYWSSPGQPNQKLDDIRASARVIASNGQYPFAGVTPILRTVISRSDAYGLAWFKEACDAFAVSPTITIRSSNGEFAGFVQALWKELPIAFKREAISVVLAKLDSKQLPSASGSASAVYASHIRTSNAMAVISDPNAALLFRMMPLIREVDPGLVEKLVQTNPALAVWREPKTQLVGQQIDFIGSSSASVSEQLNTAEELGQINDVFRESPAKGLEMAKKLNDSAARLRALDSISQTGNPETAETYGEVRTQAKELLDNVADANEKLHALAIIIEEDGRLGALQNLSTHVSAALDLGEVLVEEFFQTHPTAPLQEMQVFSPLARIVTVGMRYAPEDTLARIRRTSNTVLQAYLLIEAAKQVPIGKVEGR